MSKVTGFMMFIFGAAVGSAATWQFVKKKYEQIAQEEIDSVKETFSKKEPTVVNNMVRDKEDAKAKVSQAKEKPGVMEYAVKLREQGYTNYYNMSAEEEKEDAVSMNDKPYVIPPEEFGNIEEYEKISITYYADQILADDNDDLIEDVEDVVGFDSLTRFGEYEDDSVFVRNDKLKCDYEILLDQRRYSDVIKFNPHQTED